MKKKEVTKSTKTEHTCEHVIDDEVDSDIDQSPVSFRTLDGASIETEMHAAQTVEARPDPDDQRWYAIDPTEVCKLLVDGTPGRVPKNMA